jgi:hypothetical protein
MLRLLVTSAVFVVSLCVAAPLRAQDVPIAPPLKLPTAIWAASAAADWMTTYRFSTQYGDLLHETNPLIRGLDQHPAWLVTAGASIDVGTWWAANRFLGQKHPRWMQAALYGSAAFRMYLTAYNLQMMRRAQAIRDGRPY